MSKRPNLAAALHEAGAKPAQAQQSTAVVPTESAQVEIRSTGGRAPSREGQRAVTLYVRPEAHKQLRILAIENGASIQDLMSEALNDLFRKHGRSRIV